MAKEYLAALRSHDSGGVQYVNTLAVKADPTGPDLLEPSAAAVAHAVDDWLRATYSAVLSTRYTWDDVTVLGILGNDAEATRAIGIPGTLSLVGAVPAPKELCLVLTLKTAHVGRSGRGRQFLPGPGNANYHLDATSWATSGAAGAYYGNAVAYANALLAGHDFSFAGDVATGHVSARVYSRKDGLTRDITGYTARTAFHWLRSRSTAP